MLLSTTRLINPVCPNRLQRLKRTRNACRYGNISGITGLLSKPIRPQNNATSSKACLDAPNNRTVRAFRPVATVFFRGLRIIRKLNRYLRIKSRKILAEKKQLVPIASHDIIYNRFVARHASEEEEREPQAVTSTRTATAL